MPHGQNAGYLGKTFDPFVLNADPNDKAFKVPDLLRPDEISAVREERRRTLRASIDGAIKSFENSPDARLLDANFEGAFRMMSSPAAREAFDLKAETDAVRDRYGRTRFGQSCLLARRLVERGVRFVTVNMFETVFNEITWDIHGSAPFSPIECYKNEVGPNFDNAFTALLEDLGADRADLEHNGPGLRRVRPHSQDQPGRRSRSSPRVLDHALRGRSDPGRSGRRRFGRDRLRTQGSARDPRRDRGNRLSRPGHQPGYRVARSARQADADRGSRSRADRRSCFERSAQPE